jgi:ornithine cyclodeaminase
MMRIATRAEIEQSIDLPSLFSELEQGFARYSAKQIVVPPVGYLQLVDPPGDVHIKYGFDRDGSTYVIKIASGFPANATHGLPTGNGMMLVFDKQTGDPRALLLDEGFLTDLRTGIAGAIAAKYLAPNTVKTIGIIGTGVQARYQLRMLKYVTQCRTVMACSANTSSSVADRSARLNAYAKEMRDEGFDVTPVRHATEIAAHCQLIVTTTMARAAIFPATLVRPGTHITAMGADAPGKQELDPNLVSAASVIVADSIAQCVDHGELAHAVGAGLITHDRIVELGDVIAGRARGRTSDDEITIADLTGVAVQDIVIATHVANRLPH